MPRVWAKGHRRGGSKAASGLRRGLLALMPPHAVYIAAHPGGGTVMKRKPGALRNLGFDLDGRAAGSFECDWPVGSVHGDWHAKLTRCPCEGSELVCGDAPYLHSARTSCGWFFQRRETVRGVTLDIL